MGRLRGMLLGKAAFRCAKKSYVVCIIEERMKDTAEESKTLSGDG